MLVANINCLNYEMGGTFKSLLVRNEHELRYKEALFENI